MQCDKCKGWFHEGFTDLTVTGNNRLIGSDGMWVFDIFNMNAENLLSNIIILSTNLRRILTSEFEKR